MAEELVELGSHGTSQESAGILGYAGKGAVLLLAAGAAYAGAPMACDPTKPAVDRVAGGLMAAAGAFVVWDQLFGS